MKTYVINLEKSIDKFNSQKPILENVGLDVERFAAINAIENGKIIDKSNELENVLRTNLFSFHVLNFCN